MTEQKSSNEIRPSVLLSAFSSISFMVYSSKFSFTCRFISLMSLMSMQFLLARSYFLKIAAISFLFQFRYGFDPIAFMNQLKLIPPASSKSYQAIISYTVFLIGLNPFWVRSRVRSLGKRTPIPVESQVSKTYFKSITSSILSQPVTQSWGSKCSRSFLLNLTLNIYVVLSILPSLLSGLYPNLSFFLVTPGANDLVLGFIFTVLIEIANESI